MYLLVVRRSLENEWGAIKMLWLSMMEFLTVLQGIIRLLHYTEMSFFHPLNVNDIRMHFKTVIVKVV